jgi:hypothetical protein
LKKFKGAGHILRGLRFRLTIADSPLDLINFLLHVANLTIDSMGAISPHRRFSGKRKHQQGDLLD